MEKSPYLRLSEIGIPQYSNVTQQPENDSLDESDLENLVHQKSKLLHTKLEVLTAEILVRLNVMGRNLRGVDSQQEAVQEMLNRLDNAANYHLREHSEKSIFYQQLFDLQTERRQQEVECWRDVAMVMKDFLEIWETHQQSKGRAIFLEHAGS